MKKIISLICMLVCLYSNAQTTCPNAQPFCAGGTSGVNFPASINQPDAYSTAYNCLGTTPNPAWYYLQVSTSGNIDLYIAGTGNQDVDFICWGPFTTYSTICNNLSPINGNNVVDCSYSSSPTETCNIVGAVAGQYYMVLITNFSNVTQNIVFNQIGGSGTTNCGLLANNSSICAGGSATITANNASNLSNPSFSLNPGAQTSPTPTFVVTPLATTNYTVYVTGMNSQSQVVTQTAVATVTVKPQPAAAPTLTQASCTSTVNAFNVGLTFLPASPVPGYTITWSPIPNGITGPTQTSATGGIAAGQYNATITAAGGCSTTTSFSINPTPAPAVFNLVPGASVYTVTCAQPTVVINANPPSNTYSWTNGVSPPQTGPTGNFDALSLGTWSCFCINPTSGCTSMQVFTVTQNVSVPAATVSPLNQNITCNLSSVTTVTAVANPTTNITHSWISPSGGTLTAGSPTAIFLPGQTGTFTHCIVNNLNGCSSCTTFSVASLAAFPTYSVSSPQQFTIGCSTTSLTSINISNVGTYTAPNTPATGGPVTYTVLPPSFTGPTYTLGGSSVYTVNVPGTYTVITKDMTNGCETHVQVSIITNTSVPTITATAVTPTLSCYNPKTILQGVSGTPNVSYSWAFAGPPAGQLPNDTITVFTTTAVATQTVGTYTLTITDNINKCKSTQTLTIYQDTKPPIALITGSNQITCTTPSINLTNGSSSAPTNSVFVHPLASIGYSWTGPSPQDPAQVSSTYLAYTPGVYTMVTMDMNNGCKATATKTITDNRIYPIVNNPNPPPPFILDCGPLGTTNATIYPILSGTTTAFTYSWLAVPTVSFSSFTSSVTTVNKQGVYRIFVTNPANGCVSSGNVTVINGALTGDFTPNPQTGYAPLNVSFSNSASSSSSTTPTSSITSAWSFGNGTSSVTANVNISPTTTYTNAGTYTVTMYVVKGTCMDTVVKVITVELPSKLDVPNVFTPNGDGNNDTFFLKVQNVSEIHAYIFDRWGNQVYETTSNTGNITWDGKTASGKDMPAGTYFYIIKATGKDGTEYDKKGNVSIYR
ncbi:MAG: gliding motility-associated C-terminal domain-containing protein [Bacteroidetes bacterium]|nr:gliding motility-associated C-terminal domain-containing protein [Bacteroidota bacterium]